MGKPSPKRTSRRSALGWIAVGGGAISLPAFLRPSVAAVAGDATATDTTRLFLGGDSLPIPPTTAKRHTTACQYCNVGCGYIVYTWPVADTPRFGTGAMYEEEPTPPLGDWISPTFVTRREINGVDSYIAVVPDKDCVVNKGDHSPRGGSNALTVYTHYPHPLTTPTERLLHPQMRATKGAALARTSWDHALDVIADRIKQTLDTKGPSAIGLWGADHLSPEKNYMECKLLFSPQPVGLYDASRGPVDGVPVRAIHNRAKFNSEYPSLADHFGSNNALLYSYSDLEAADTVLLSGVNSYETGTVLYNRIHAAPNKKVVIDPRRTVPAANAEAGGGVHLALRPGTDVVLVNSLMNVILGEGLHDADFIAQRVEPETFAALRALVSQDRWAPESTAAVTSVPAEKVRTAAKLLGRPSKTSILFEKGVIWQGTQNEAVIGSYANLALLLGSVGSPGRVIGRQGGHQDAIVNGVDHPESDPDQRRNLWQELAAGTIDVLIATIANPVRMSEQSQQLREFVSNVPFVVEVNIRPSDMTQLADVSLPSTAWGEYDYSRQNLERRVRLNQAFVPPAGEARPEYLIVAQMAKRLADRHGVLDPHEWAFTRQEQVWDELRHTKEGIDNGLHLLSRGDLLWLGTNGVQLPITAVRKSDVLGGAKEFVGTERLYADSFPSPSGKASFVPRDQAWTEADPLAFLPAEIKPDADHPFFVTTVRYQYVWQSGYTYRWTTDLAKQLPYPEVTVHPDDARQLGIGDGDWVELSNQYGKTRAVANVSTIVQKGLLSIVFAWQGPTDRLATGEPDLYANNLIAGGQLLQKSNAAYFKNAHAALVKLDTPPITTKNSPTMSFQDRVIEGSSSGAAGEPGSIWNEHASGG